MIITLYGIVSLLIGIVSAIYSAITRATTNLLDTILIGIMTAIGWPLLVLTYGAGQIRNKLRKDN